MSRWITWIALGWMIMWRCSAFATTYYVSGNNGNDGNDGLSWAAPKLTPANVANTYTLTTDTVVIAGTVTGDTDWGVDDTGGTSGDYLVYIDSTAFANGGIVSGTTDTTIIWGSTWNAFIDVLNADYVRFVGLNLVKSVSAEIFEFTTTSEHFIAEQCRFTSTNAGESYIEFQSTQTCNDINFYNCLFISNNQLQVIFANNPTAVDADFINCTFYGTYTQYGLMGDNLAPNNWDLTIKNCIVYNTSTNTGDRLYNTANADTSFTFDYNIWKIDHASTLWYWNGNISTFGDWQIALQIFDVNNEVNSLYQDPNLLYVTTTCVPNEPVPGTNLGYGGDIGWFQSGGGSQIILFGGLYEEIYYNEFTGFSDSWLLDAGQAEEYISSD